MKCGEAIYWTRKMLEGVRDEINGQDYLSNDESDLLKEVCMAIGELDKTEDLVDWLEVNNYIREEI